MFTIEINSDGQWIAIAVSGTLEDARYWAAMFATAIGCGARVVSGFVPDQPRESEPAIADADASFLTACGISTK